LPQSIGHQFLDHPIQPEHDNPKPVEARRSLRNDFQVASQSTGLDAGCPDDRGGLDAMTAPGPVLHLDPVLRRIDDLRPEE
jgi:hypothetical protein